VKKESKKTPTYKHGSFFHYASSVVFVRAAIKDV
jgi:hypothetical protein